MGCTGVSVWRANYVSAIYVRRRFWRVRYLRSPRTTCATIQGGGGRGARRAATHRWQLADGLACFVRVVCATLPRCFAFQISRALRFAFIGARAMDTYLVHSPFAVTSLRLLPL